MVLYMDYLGKLFGSPAKVKLLRLFTFNPENAYDRETVVRFARITPDTASRELTLLTRANIIQRKDFFKEIKHPGSKVAKKRKTIGWTLNKKYPLITQLQQFMRNTLTVSEAEVRKRFRGSGSIRLLVLSGFFAGNKESTLDILIVGEHMKELVIKNAIQSLEGECGQEIRYMILSTEEYQYRRRVRDIVIRNVMDFPHKEVTNQLSKV